MRKNFSKYKSQIEADEIKCLPNFAILILLLIFPKFTFAQLIRFLCPFDVDFASVHRRQVTFLICFD